MEDINALYKALEQADAAGDTASAQKLADQIRLIAPDEGSDEIDTDPDVDSLYSLLEEADAAGDTATAQKLADQIRSLSPQEPVEKTPTVTKEAAPAAKPTIDVMGQQFTPEEYAKYSGMPIAAKPGEQAKGEFSGNFGRSLYDLAADLTLVYGKTTGNIKQAEEEAKRLREYGEKTYTPSTKTFQEDPIAKIQQLAGNSAPYMIGTIAASIGSSGLGLTGLAGTALPFFTSATQFVGSNLQRQMDTGKKLEEAKLSKAVPGALFQASLDIIGLKYIPYLKNLFKASGKEITDQAAKQIIQKSIVQKAGDKLIDTGKGMFIEGTTEAGQQFIERLQAGLQVASPDAMQEYFDSFIGGSILAGSIGISGNIIESLGPKEQKDIEDKVEQSELSEDKKQKERPSRDTLIDATWEDLKSKAKPKVNLPTISKEGAEADQGKLFNVVGGPSVEVGKPIIVGVLDKDTLTSWGLNPRSNAFKALEGVDASTEEGLDLINKTLEANKGKINESAVDDYLKGVESGRPITGTATVGDEVLGGQVDGIAGGTEGRFGPAVDFSGSLAGIPQTGTTLSDDTLKTVKGPEAKAKAEPTQGKERIMSVMEMLNQPDLNLRYEARRRYFDDLKAKEAEKYAKYVSKLRELAKKVSPTLPIIKQSNNLANVLSALKDPPRYLIEDLKNPNVIDTEREELNQQARDYITLSNLYDEYKVKMTPQEKKALMKEGVEAAKGETAPAPKDLTDEEFRAMQDEFLAGREEPLESKAEGTPEGQAIVNTTKPANTMGQALSIIKRQHFNKLNPVQKVLHNLFETLPNVLKGKYKVMGMPKGEFGKYRAVLNDTTISPKAGADSIYHEGTHAATVWAARRHVTMDKNGRPKAKGNSVVGQQLVDIFDAAEVAAMQEEVTFGDAFKNMEEFLAYAFNDLEFQRFLARQKSVAPTPAPKASLWSDLMDAFNRLLGLDISNTLMSDIVGLAPDLMTGERPGPIAMLGPETTYAHRSAKDMDDQLRKTGTVRPQVEPPKLPFSPARIINQFRKAAFSFDMSVNKKILNAIKQAGISMEDYAKAFYELTISQAVRADAMAAAFLHYGNIIYNPEKFKFDITQSDKSMKKINDILRDVAKKYKYDIVKTYQYASAAFIARRSEGLIEANKKLKAEVLNLLNQGKEQEALKRLKKGYKLVHMTRSEIKEGLKFFEDIPELEQVYEIWNSVREKVLNFAVNEQLYTREKADDLLSIMDYVPFYTIAQLEAKKGPKEFSNGLLDATRSKAFRGSHQEVNNVIDNMERWVSYVIRKGINNRYAKNKIDLYKQFVPDDIKEVSESERIDNTVTIWENGSTKRYAFQGPDGAHMVDGFTGLEPVMIPWLRFVSKPSKFLRLNIVLNPIFSLRQIPMDMFNAMTAAGVKHPYMIPLQVMKEIVLTPLFLSNARQELKKTITVGQPDYSKEFNHIDVEASKEARKLTTFDKLLKAIMSPLTFLSMASDNVIRQAVYSQHLLETGDIALATNAAEEIINFRRTGSSQGIAIVRQIAPFVNANLQGLHINLATLGSESINPLTRKQALLRYFTGGATIVGATLLYLSLMADDDEYTKLDPTERDAFFILPNGYKIPMRYDLPTLLFKVIPEHFFNRFIKETEDPTKFKKALKEGTVRALATPSIMPTLFAAPFEASLNKDFTTNRDIVGQGLQGLEPEQQYSPKYTSELSRILSGNLVSPMQMDHFLQKYLGSTMGVISWITNDMIAEKQGRQRPELSFREKLLQVPNMSGFVTKLEGSRNINDFYELNKEVQRVVKSYPDYKDVSIEEAQKYLDKDNNRELIQLQKSMDRVSRFLSRLREEENRVYKSTTMSAKDKKAALDRIVRDRQEALGFKVQIGETKDRYIQQLRKQGGL